MHGRDVLRGLRGGVWQGVRTVAGGCLHHRHGCRAVHQRRGSGVRLRCGAHPHEGDDHRRVLVHGVHRQPAGRLPVQPVRADVARELLRPAGHHDAHGRRRVLRGHAALRGAQPDRRQVEG